MRWISTPSAMALLAGLLLSGIAQAAEPTARAEDEQRLQALKVGTSGPELLEFFRVRARPEYDHAKMTALFKDLGNDSDKVSSRATRELVSLGAVAVPWLRQALSDPDNKLTAQRARLCLEAIEGTDGSAFTVAAVRTLALRRPEGAIKALLDYLPFAEDESVVDEIREALASLAVRDGRADPDLVAALKDAVPVRRATAAEALCQAGAYRELPALRSLLSDDKPTVRVRAALALARIKEEGAIPVLIESLGQVDEARARQAEELLLQLAGTTAPSVPLGKDDAGRKRCHDTWLTWWKSFQDKDLLEYFRQRTLDDASQARFQALVRQLGSDSFSARQKAMKTLVAYRNAAVPILNRALNDPDREIVQRAERCLSLIQKAPHAELSAAHARLIGYRKPAGGIEVLLAYLPYADDEAVAEEVRGSLVAMALREGKADPALLAGLEDKHPVRRAAAAQALIRTGAVGGHEAVARLLSDPDPTVRYQVALALADARHREAVPVLIDLLDKLPGDQAGEVEGLLRRLADDKAPTLALGEDAASKQKCREAWAKWWQERGPHIDLARLDSGPRLLGYTDIAQYMNNGTGEIVEVGRNGKVRWTITGINYAFDVQVLPRNRVLIPEYNSSKVTERDFKGNVKWEYSVYAPICVQRLPNGDTFIASRNQLLQIDKNKKEIFKIQRPSYDIMGAQKLRNGQIVMLTSAGQCLRMDKDGKEQKSFTVGPVNHYGCLDVLANGHVLVAVYSQNKVIEFDKNGKSVWQATVQWPSSVTRLPNGHTLVACQDASTVLELNRGGKKVWEFKTSGRPWRARRR